MIETLKNKTVSELIEYDEAAGILARRYLMPESGSNGLDLDSFCKEHGVESDFFLEVLNTFHESENNLTERFDRFPIPFLVQYLRKTHNYYLNQNLNEIEMTLLQMQMIGSEQEKEMLLVLHRYFVGFKMQLTEHILGEERELFPFILYLHDLEFKGTSDKALAEKDTLDAFEKNHDHKTEDLIAGILEYLLKQEPTPDMESPYRVLCRQIESFERDLRVHAAIEDEVLVPRAQKLYKELMNF